MSTFDGKDCLVVIEILREGNMLSQPSLLKNHVDRAQSTNNYSQLFEYLRKFPFILSIAKRNIRIAEHQSAKNPFTPFPQRQEVVDSLSGPIVLGRVNLYSDLFGVHPNVFCTPTLNMGPPGSGKSVLNKFIVYQLDSMSPNFLIPDLKREYRDILPLCKNLNVITENNVLINFLEVPDWCHPMDHIISFSKNFVRMNYLVGTSENELIDILEYLYRVRGVFDGSKNYPTIHDLYRFVISKLKTIKSFRYADIFEWLKNRLKPYTLINNFACQHGIPFDYFINNNIILELDQKFSDMQFNLINAHIAKQIYDYSKKKRLVGSKLRTLFLVDEARILFDANRDVSTFGENPLNEIVSKSRELGLGFLVCSQETSSFNRVICGLSRLKIAFPLSDGKDVDFVEESFGLDEDQKKFIFSLPSQAVALIRYSEFHRPFLLNVSHFEIHEELSDDDVRLRMAGFYTDLLHRIKNPKVTESLIIPKTIPPAAIALLFFLSKEPFTKVSDMTNAPGFKSPADVNNALNWLEENRYINKESYRISKRGRPSTFAVFTSISYNYLGIEGFSGKGNFEHKLYQHLISHKLTEDGWTAKIEGKMKGSQKSIDILANSKEKGYVAYEITLHTKNIISNIIKDLGSGLPEVVIVVRDKKGIKKAIQIVDDTPALYQQRHRISFCTISDFF